MKSLEDRGTKHQIHPHTDIEQPTSTHFYKGTLQSTLILCVCDGLHLLVRFLSSSTFCWRKMFYHTRNRHVTDTHTQTHKRVHCEWKRHWLVCVCVCAPLGAWVCSVCLVILNAVPAERFQKLLHRAPGSCVCHHDLWPLRPAWQQECRGYLHCWNWWSPGACFHFSISHIFSLYIFCIDTRSLFILSLFKHTCDM